MGARFPGCITKPEIYGEKDALEMVTPIGARIKK